MREDSCPTCLEFKRYVDDDELMPNATACEDCLAAAYEAVHDPGKKEDL